jgi:hypothetical protein
MIKRWVLFFCYAETIGFEGNYIDLKQGLSRANNDFYMEWLSRKQIGLQAIESVGTFSMSGIRVYATIQNTQASQLQIRLQGQINYEVLFFQAISVLMLLGITANAIATVSLSILCCIFFNAFFSCMYYFQQRNLCYKFRRFVQA